MGWSFLQEPTKYELELNREGASLNRMSSNQAVSPAV
jgi:hypothetical protein